MVCDKVQLNNFKKIICKLNSAFYFASLTANIFWICGHIFCMVFTLHPEPHLSIPSFNSFHIFQQHRGSTGGYKLS